MTHFVDELRLGLVARRPVCDLDDLALAVRPDHEAGSEVDAILEEVVLRVEEHLHESRERVRLGKRPEPGAVDPRERLDLRMPVACDCSRALDVQVEVRAKRPLSVRAAPGAPGSATIRKR